MKTVVTPTTCELAVKIIIPSLRALVAKELVQTYSFRQQDVASFLGVTQSAISQYVRSARGNTLDLNGVTPIDKIVKDTAKLVSKKRISPVNINRMYCVACKIIREKRLMCDVHKKFDPSFVIIGCEECSSSEVC